MSQASEKPPPPIRRASSALSQEAEQETEPGSNNTTPRGSMEFLPPPPPHLLHSDEEAEEEGRAPSVAESVRALTLRQNNLATPRQPSPAALRFVLGYLCFNLTKEFLLNSFTMQKVLF